MAGLINLPGYNPGNALNFSGINQAIDSNRQNALAQQQLGMQQDRLGMDRERLGMEKQQFDQKQQMQTVQRFAGIAQGIDQMTDPTARTAAWQNLIAQHPNAAQLPEIYRDPIRGPKLLMQEAQGFVDPLDRRAKESTIGMQGAHADYFRAQAEKARREASAEGAYGKDAKFFQDPSTGNTYAIQFGAGGQPKYHLIQSPGQPGPQAPPNSSPTGFAQPNSAPQAKPQPLRPIGTTVAGDTMFDRFGQPIRSLAANIENKETAEEIGKSRGLARVNLDKIEQGAASTLRYLDDLEKDPNLASVIGPIDSRTPNWFNQGVESKIDQLGGRAFLEAFASIKGGGAITEPEGAKATVALSRLMNKGLSMPEYKQAMADFRREVIELRELARRKASGGYAAPGGAASPSAAPKRLRYNPATGELE